MDASSLALKVALPAGVEVTCRVQAGGRSIYFLLNHNETTEQVTLPAGKFIALLNGEEVEGRLEIAARNLVVLEPEEL